MTGATALLAATMIATSLAALAGEIGTNTRLDNAIGITMLTIGVPLAPWVYVNKAWALYATLLGAAAVALAPWAKSGVTKLVTGACAAGAVRRVE